jgi:hypothetical protein
VEKCGTARQAADDNIMRRRKDAIAYQKTKAYSPYISFAIKKKVS